MIRFVKSKVEEGSNCVVWIANAECRVLKCRMLSATTLLVCAFHVWERKLHGAGFCSNMGGRPTLPWLASVTARVVRVGPATRSLKIELWLRVRQARRPVARSCNQFSHMLRCWPQAARPDMINKVDPWMRSQITKQLGFLKWLPQRTPTRGWPDVASGKSARSCFHPPMGTGADS